MNGSFRFALVVATLTVSVGCSRRTGGAAAADSSAPNADSITAATVGRPGTGPSGGISKPVGPVSATNQTKTGTSSGATGAAQVGSRPHLIKLTPSSGSLASGQVITVEIAGDRFTAAGNTTFFGSMTLGDLPSIGHTIRFAVPTTLPSRGEVPPMAIQAGRYSVYVVNANGTSDTLTFTIRDQP